MTKYKYRATRRVEAIRFDGKLEPVSVFCGGASIFENDGSLYIEVPDVGWCRCPPGAYIVKTPQGTFAPTAAEQFEALFEPADADTPEPLTLQIETPILAMMANGVPCDLQTDQGVSVHVTHLRDPDYEFLCECRLTPASQEESRELSLLFYLTRVNAGHDAATLLDSPVPELSEFIAVIGEKARARGYVEGAHPKLTAAGRAWFDEQMEAIRRENAERAP